MSRYPPQQQSYGYGSPYGSQSNLYQKEGEGGAGYYYPNEKANKKPSHKWRWIVIGLVVLACLIAGGVLGGIFGSRAANKNKSENEQAGALAGQGSSPSSASSSSAGSGSTGAAPTTGAATSSSSSAAPTQSSTGNFAVTPLSTWDWATDKAIGVCLGNWLLLERWMNEDWFVQQAGANVWDEWGFTQALGQEKAAQVLQDHFNSWITEDDIETVYQHGVNIMRIPTGFWAWIPTQGDEPYVYAGQRDQVTRIMGYAYARGMRVLIDLHGLPGSQNGEQTSGHNTTSPSWFNNATNQARSDDSVKAVLSFIENHPYRSTVAGIEIINEPRPYTTQQNSELQDYYTRSYQAIQSSSYPVTMIFADGYLGAEYWRSWASQYATNPPSLVFEDHPYPGNFPPQTDQSNILQQVCTAGNKYVGYPVPVAITEWSLYTGVKDQTFEQTFYEAQLATWAWSAGSLYWTLRLIPSSIQLAAGLDYTQYSFLTVIANNTATIPSANTFGLSNTTTRSNAVSYLSQIKNNCGSQPANAAPASVGSDPAWSVGLAAQSSAATQTLYATTGAAASATARARYARSL